jgi:hypothetical protein
MKELDFYSDKMKEAQKLTGLISDYLNNFNYKENSAYFNEAMSREHRTLQQNFARLIFAYIEYMASDEYRTDGRNHDSAVISEDLIKGFEKLMEDRYGRSEGNRKPSTWLGTI